MKSQWTMKTNYPNFCKNLMCKSSATWFVFDPEGNFHKRYCFACAQMFTTKKNLALKEKK